MRREDKERYWATFAPTFGVMLRELRRQHPAVKQKDLAGPAAALADAICEPAGLDCPLLVPPSVRKREAA